MTRRLRASAHALGALLMAACCLEHCAAAQPLTLRYGQDWSSAHSIFSLPIFVAQREGLFRRAGLDFQVVIPVPGGSDKMVFDALNKGWIDVTHIATPFLIRAAMNGADVVAIDAEFKNAIYSLVARPDIRSYADLKGKRIGLADEQGSITIAMRKLLAKHGLERGSFAVKTEEGTPQRFYCLVHGDCDAAALGQPQDLQALAQGYSLLGRSDEVVPDYLYTVTAVRRPWAAAHRDEVIRYVRAMAGAFAFIRDPANRSKVIADIVAAIGFSDTIAGRTLDLFNEPGRNVLPQCGEIDLKGLQQVIAMMAEANLLKPPLPQAERFVDLQYLRDAGVQ